MTDMNSKIFTILKQGFMFGLGYFYQHGLCLGDWVKRL